MDMDLRRITALTKPGIAMLVMVLAASASGDTTVEQQIRDLDAKEAAAMLAADTAALDAIWSAGFTVNAPDNTVKSKEQVLGAVRESRIAYSGFERTVERVVVLDADCIVSMGGEVVVPKGDRPDAGQRVPRRYSHVWKKVNGTWGLVARHANVAPPAR
jgi:hypothetical protein